MSKIPDEFLCPLTLEVMKDPVIGPDGHTYERNAISEWLQQKNISPITRQVMKSKDLIPNIALRHTIEQYMNAGKTGGHVDGASASSSPSVNVPVQTSKTSEKIDVKLSMSPVQSNCSWVHISMNPPNLLERKPCVLIAILDVSSSMNEAAMNDKTATTTTEATFSRLDLVKHSMRTVTNLLGEHDYLCIIPFSNSAHILLPLTSMNHLGKKKANWELENLKANGVTNIWDGLRIALDVTKNPICENQNVTLLLLTDGEPNINPPRGIIPTLKKHAKNYSSDCTIHTFGFGYELDTELLNDIADVGCGTYSYIPDCSMVGTIFVNFMSNTLATMINRAHLSLTEQNGAKIIDTIGYGGPLNDIQLGSIYYGQTKDLIVKLSIPEGTNSPYLSISLNLSNGMIVNETLLETHQVNELNPIYRNYYRLLVVDRIREAINIYNECGNLNESKKVIDKTIEELCTSPFKNDSFVKNLILDLKSAKEHEGGQVLRAFSKISWYKKWGTHYLPSFMRAHQMQICNNFKDPGIQSYGGELFEMIRDEADNIFCQLPPPKPSSPLQVNTTQGTTQGGTQTSRSSASSVTVRSMSSFYNQGGVCFDGQNWIEMADNTFKRVQNLAKGDIVKSSGNCSARVKCVIKTKISGGRTQFVELNGLRITPWHPIKLNGNWVFPHDIKHATTMRCDYVYNLVLDHAHVVIISGIECVTLGHGFTDNDVIRHPYFGTKRVIDDLRTMSGWENGFIEMNQSNVSRERKTGFVCSIVKKPTPTPTPTPTATLTPEADVIDTYIDF